MDKYASNQIYSHFNYGDLSFYWKLSAKATQKEETNEPA